jgi:hypothetical protein
LRSSSSKNFKSLDSVEATKAPEPNAEGDAEHKEEIARASKMDFKTVKEVCVSDKEFK